MRAARIENNVVVDLWEVPSLDCYGDLYDLVAAPDDVQIGATYEDGVFTNPPLPPKTREQLIAELKQQRDAEIAEGVLHDGHRYPADEVFRDALMGFLLAWDNGKLAPDERVLIRRMDDTNVLMNRVEVTELAAAVMAHVQGAYVRYWTTKDALGT